jgi:hypothetical protein
MMLWMFVCGIPYLIVINCSTWTNGEQGCVRMLDVMSSTATGASVIPRLLSWLTQVKL